MMKDMNEFINTVAEMREAQRQYHLRGGRIFRKHRDDMQDEIDAMLEDHYAGRRRISEPFNIQLSYEQRWRD